MTLLTKKSSRFLIQITPRKRDIQYVETQSKLNEKDESKMCITLSDKKMVKSEVFRISNAPVIKGRFTLTKVKSLNSTPPPSDILTDTLKEIDLIAPINRSSDEILINRKEKRISIRIETIPEEIEDLIVFD